MSAVQYPCGVISVPTHSRTSMRYEVRVEQGINLLIKKVGQQAAYVPAEATGVEEIDLAPGHSHTTPPVTSVCVMTTIPVQVTVTLGIISMTFVVNSILLLDDAYDSVTVANPNTATQSANVSLFYTKP